MRGILKVFLAESAGKIDFLTVRQNVLVQRTNKVCALFWYITTSIFNHPNIVHLSCLDPKMTIDSDVAWSQTPR